MCGISGFIDRSGRTEEELVSIARAMGDMVAHRGPDDEGQWTSVRSGVGLAHRRLAVLDLSPAGHQPMISRSGRFVLVFNGEIYNHEELRGQLPQQSWRGHSDTETLVALIDEWGVEAALKKSSGMFALALWDRERHEITLARDRMGEKPLYFGHQGGVFLFGSELKSLRRHPSFEGEIDRAALELFLRHGYIPAPSTIYRGICKLLPGTILTVGESPSAPLPEPVAYWSLEHVVSDQSQEFDSDEHAIACLEESLSRSVRRQMISDVPLGAFLSGGVDSSLIVAMMQANSSRAVKTFTIGFHERGYDEAGHAKSVARHLGTDHTELYVTSEDAMEVIPDLPQVYDEPFADSSQIPTCLVARLARGSVTVALTGDGGDELFGGYSRYQRTARLWRSLSLLPRSVRTGASNVLASTVGGHIAERLSQVLHGFRDSDGNPIPERARGLAGTLLCDDVLQLYRYLISQWRNTAALVRGPSADPWTPNQFGVSLPSDEERMMFFDSVSYLPDDILVKVDRAAMAVGLETRVPLLDHDVVELAWNLPLPLKIRDGQGKWIMRQLLDRYVPKHLIERPKMGFAVPVDHWIRGPLRNWAEDLLDEQRILNEGFFDPQPIRKRWEQHLSGRYNWRDSLWLVLSFQSWLDNARRNTSS